MSRLVRLGAATLVGFMGAASLAVAVSPRQAALLDVVSVPTWGWRQHVMSIAGMVCLGVVPGLARGRRAAWWIGLAGLGAIAAAGFVNHAELTLTGPLVATATILLVAGGSFTGRADVLLVRSGLVWLVVGEAAVLVYGAVGLYLLDAEFRESTDLLTSIREGVRLVFLLPPGTLTPATPHGAWFLDSVRWLSFAVLAASAVRLLAPSRARPNPRESREQVQRILESWATTSIAPFHLLEDKHWCFSPDRQAFVGYALVGNRAVALGGPVGHPGSREAALQAFLDLCASNGWSPSVHQANEDDAALLAARGFKLLKIGDEAIVDLASFTLSGRAAKSVRSSLNMGERMGLTTELLPTPIDPRTMAALKSVSDAWLAETGHRERGFTLGRFDADALRNEPVVIVRNATGRIIAFANVIPSYRSGIGNFDLMRRLPNAPKGTMELLFVALIDRFRSEGKTGMSLGLAPLANLGEDTAMERLLAAIRDHAGRAFRFVGVFEFKSKWRPRWEPRYLAYPGTAQLPQAALALVRAGERPAPGWTEARMRRLLGVYPFSLALTAVTLWMMAATRGDPGFHDRMMRWFGSSWSDLVHGEIWRIPAAALVPEDAGYRWTVVALLVSVWFAERRLRTGWAVASYFALDAVASLLTLVGIRIAVAFGNGEALGALAERDSGPSAACVGLAALLIATVASSSIRRIGFGSLAVGLAISAAIDPSRAAVSHTVAAIAGAALGVVVARRASIAGEPTAIRPTGSSTPT